MHARQWWLRWVNCMEFFGFLWKWLLGFVQWWWCRECDGGSLWCGDVERREKKNKYLSEVRNKVLSLMCVHTKRGYLN